MAFRAAGLLQGKVTLGKMDANMGLAENASADERESAQVAMVQNLTRAYFRIVKKNLIDGTPKAIMFVCSVPYLNPPYSPTSRHLLPGFWLFG